MGRLYSMIELSKCNNQGKQSSGCVFCGEAIQICSLAAAEGVDQPSPGQSERQLTSDSLVGKDKLAI